jgi:broad specificity phosphatase PhoE
MCPVEAANDLLAKETYTGESEEKRRTRAIEEVRTSAETLGGTLDKSVPVFILSSPVGRTLHTAKIISEVLSEKGFTVNPIKTEKILGEVENFSWTLFEPLMNGGIVTYHDQGEKKFEVNKSETNPRNLGYPDYFMDDSAHQIPPHVKETWPEVYRGMVDGFEKFHDVTHRFLSKIQSLGNQEEGNFILVTHDCATMHLADSFTDGRQKGLVPGTFIHIERGNDSHLYVKRVGDITDGDTRADFIASWFAYEQARKM